MSRIKAFTKGVLGGLAAGTALGMVLQGTLFQPKKPKWQRVASRALNSIGTVIDGMAEFVR